MILPTAIACGTAVSANESNAELTTLNVAVVPAVDSAGFFVALYRGLFGAQGLTVHFIPVVSSESEINQQVEQLPTAPRVDIS